MGIVDAFREYDAELKNVQWSVSSISEKGELVVSCWRQKLKFIKNERILQYTDELNRWREGSPGGTELKENLQDAYDKETEVRLVIVDTMEKSAVDESTNLSKIQKTYAVKKDVIGRVREFDGNKYVIDFQENSTK